MQIALIADHFGPLRGQPAAAYPGEDSAAWYGLAQALGQLEQDVTIYARRAAASWPGAAELAPRVSVEYLDAGPRTRLAGDKLLPHVAAFSLQLAGRWRDRPPEVAHGLSWTTSMVALAAARDLAVPVVQTFRPVRSDPRRRRASAARERLEAAAGRSADAVLAGNSADQAELARLGVAPAAIRLVPPGVDPELFRPEGPAAARRDERVRLLMITSLADDSEPAQILPALTRLPDVELLLAGGPARSRLARDRVGRGLTRLARQLDLADRLVLTGKLTRADAPALLRSADLLVNLATGPPFDAVTLDAMACGVPVLAVASGLQEDAIVDGITGFLLPAAAPGLVADRIHRFLRNPMAREGLGIAAASRAHERYAWARVARETLTVYQSVASSGSDSGSG